MVEVCSTITDTARIRGQPAISSLFKLCRSVQNGGNNNRGGEKGANAQKSFLTSRVKPHCRQPGHQYTKFYIVLQ